ncbi:MAG TPA: sulfate transporter family protein [Roseiarcus sp.]|nr:sulfate transporter family protein [Roseiarcus sp.]
MIQDAVDAFAQIFTPPFRAVLIKSLALTLAILIIAWFGLDRLLVSFVGFGPSWLSTILAILAGLGLFVGLAFLVAPITSLTAGFFLDEIALVVEREINPSGPLGQPVAFGAAALCALRFAGLSILVNLVALALLLAPGVNVFAFLAANGYLLGREYFELAAMRYRSFEEARAMRRHFGVQVFAAGLIVAGFVAVPVLNLCTPLFATAFMTRLHRRWTLERTSSGQPR